MADLTAKELATLEAEARSGVKRPAATAIPIRLVENITLQIVNAHTIRRNLEGHTTRDGPITGIEWFLVHYDSTAAIYAAACPYPFCDGRGMIEAMGLIDSRGRLELPFADPGPLCCDHCDSEISNLYEAEAAKLAKPKRVMTAKPMPTKTAETVGE